MSEEIASEEKMPVGMVSEGMTAEKITTENITTEEFVGILLRRFALGNNGCEDSFSYGCRKGWLEEQDRPVWKRAVERRAAARIVHEFLRREWGEQDEADWGNARKLKDLYDCRVCANHVAQVYAKGIMQGKKSDVFGMREGITEAEANEIAERMLRIRRNAPGHISRSEALEMLRSEGKILLADVRTRQEYERGHLQGAVHIPFTALLESSGTQEKNVTEPILLYCDQGYRSEIAANCLAEAGYERVYYFEWEG